MVLGEIFSFQDIAVVLIVVLLVFGGSKLPKLARSLGSATSEFKKGVEEGNAATPAAPNSAITPPVAQPATPAPEAHPTTSLE